jgi:O-antigen ligase
MWNHNILLIPLAIALILFFSKKLNHRSFVLFVAIFLVFVRDYEHKLVDEDFFFHQSIRFTMLSFLLLSIFSLSFEKILNRMFTPIGIFGAFYLLSYFWGMLQGSSLVIVIGDLLCVFIIALMMEKTNDWKEVTYAIVIFVIIGGIVAFFPVVGQNFHELTYNSLKKHVMFTNPLAYEIVWFATIGSIATLLVEVPKKFKVVATIILVAALYSLIIIQSRTETISIFAAVIISLAINRKWYFVALTAVIAYAVFYYGNNMLDTIYPEDVRDDFLRKLTLEDDTRVWIWNIALQKFWESPLIGHGIGAASMLNSEAGTHSGVLTILVNVGIVGASLFFYAVIWSLHKHWFYMKKATSQMGKWYYTFMFIGLIAYILRMIPNGTLFTPFLIISLISADNIYFKEKLYKSAVEKHHFSKLGSLVIDRFSGRG